MSAVVNPLPGPKMRCNQCGGTLARLRGSSTAWHHIRWSVGNVGSPGVYKPGKKPRPVWTCLLVNRHHIEPVVAITEEEYKRRDDAEYAAASRRIME